MTTRFPPPLPFPHRTPKTRLLLLLLLSLLFFFAGGSKSVFSSSSSSDDDDDLLHQHHRDVRDTALSLLVNDRDVTETDRYDKSARTSFFFLTSSSSSFHVVFDLFELTKNKTYSLFLSF
jgi:hypothetical protein